jgi:hypothetical protein
MPKVDDALEALVGMDLFSTFELASGFWQVPMKEEDIPKTAFVTRQGLFEWTRTPFGLKCAPETFCRMMHYTLAGLTYLLCLVYVEFFVMQTSEKAKCGFRQDPGGGYQS